MPLQLPARRHQVYGNFGLIWPYLALFGSVPHVVLSHAPPHTRRVTYFTECFFPFGGGECRSLLAIRCYAQFMSSGPRPKAARPDRGGAGIGIGIPMALGGGGDGGGGTCTCGNWSKADCPPDMPGPTGDCCGPVNGPSTGQHRPLRHFRIALCTRIMCTPSPCAPPHPVHPTLSTPPCPPTSCLP